MTREELFDDNNFRNKCNRYGLYCFDPDFVNGMIVLHSPKKNIITILDEHYNIMGVYDKNVDYYGFLSYEDPSKWSNPYRNVRGYLPYPFQEFSLEQIDLIGDRIKVHETNHGHSTDIFVNEELANDKYDSNQIALLLYIKFLKLQMEEYYKNLSHMKNLGLEYPTVYNYIGSLVYNIEECIKEKISANNAPNAYDVVEYLGITSEDMRDYCNLLPKVVRLYLKQYGYKDNSHFELEKNRKE